MATLSTLVVNLTANTADYQKGMSKAGKITQSVTKNIQRVGKVAMGVAAGLWHPVHDHFLHRLNAGTSGTGPRGPKDPDGHSPGRSNEGGRTFRNPLL